MSISINSFKSCYIIGIGGSGMSSIAKYLFQKGLEVSGYDQRSSYITNLLNNDGIKVDFDISTATYNSETLYIVSSAINMEHTFLSDYVNQPNVLTRPNFLKLLSIPTISKPLSWKKFTVSDPTNPVEPVMIATDIRNISLILIYFFLTINTYH